MNKKISTQLIKKFDGKERLLRFFLAWLEHGRNGVKAYQSLHPACTYSSAGAISSQMLSEITAIDRNIVLEAYGIGQDTYLKKLKEGLEAVDALGNPDHRTRHLYHKDLGEILNFRKDGGDVNIQINNNKIIFEDFSSRNSSPEAPQAP